MSTKKENRSSLSELKHGRYTRRVIAKGEQQEEIDALHEWWVSHYDFDEARPLLEEAVFNEWLLRKTHRNLAELDEQLAKTDPKNWTEAQMQLLDLMLREKTAAEQSFHRSLAAVERFSHARC